MRLRRGSHDTSPFGRDRFGQGAERFARLIGTPGFIVGQTIIVVIWICLNVFGVVNHWDPYPFILLNLGFSTQAAYATPLILLAETRQADRDRLAELDALHQRERVAERDERMMARIEQLTELVYEHVLNQESE